MLAVDPSFASTTFMVPVSSAPLGSVNYSTRLMHGQRVDARMLYFHVGRSDEKIVLNNTKEYSVRRW